MSPFMSLKKMDCLNFLLHYWHDSIFDEFFYGEIICSKLKIFLHNFHRQNVFRLYEQLFRDFCSYLCVWTSDCNVYKSKVSPQYEFFHVFSRWKIVWNFCCKICMQKAFLLYGPFHEPSRQISAWISCYNIDRLIGLIELHCLQGSLFWHFWKWHHF